MKRDREEEMTAYPNINLQNTFRPSSTYEHTHTHTHTRILSLYVSERVTHFLCDTSIVPESSLFGTVKVVVDHHHLAHAELVEVM